jgi:hypothetical protein
MCWKEVGAALTGGGSQVAQGLGLPEDVATSFATLGNSDIGIGTGDGFNLMNLGKKAFDYTDEKMGTGSLNQQIGDVANTIALAYGTGSAGNALSGALAPATGATATIPLDAGALTAADTAGTVSSAGSILAPPTASIGPGAAGAAGASLGADLLQTGEGNVPAAERMKPVDMSMNQNGVFTADDFLKSALPMNYTDSMWGPQTADVPFGMEPTYPSTGAPNISGEGAWPSPESLSPEQTYQLDENGQPVSKSTPKAMMDYLKTVKGGTWGKLGMAGLNVANSFNQANMMKGVNDAQQKSYQDYLNAINPTPAVKQTQYNTLAGNVDTQANIAQKQTADSLAARGIRGKGAAAPVGDVSEASRMAKNAAYNKIFGTYNVPGSPGPANYSPSATNIGVGNASQLTNYLLPLYQMMQSYGKGA